MKKIIIIATTVIAVAFFSDSTNKYKEDIDKELIRLGECPVNYPQTKDLWASGFITDNLRLGITSAPPV